MELDLLRPQLMSILSEHRDRWWPSYSIWFRLRERFPREAQTLSDEYGGRIGDGGGGPGGHYGMVSYISQSLARVPDLVQAEHLHTDGFAFDGVEPSGPTIAIFRLR